MPFTISSNPDFHKRVLCIVISIYDAMRCGKRPRQGFIWELAGQPDSSRMAFEVDQEQRDRCGGNSADTTGLADGFWSRTLEL